MAVPDVGLAPPPPVDVASQMKPSTPPGGPGGADLSGILAMLGGGQAPPIGPDLTPKIMQVQPVLLQIARQVPALGPDVDRLNVELKSRMGGLPAALAGLAGGPPLPAGAPAGSGPPPMAAAGTPMGAAGVSPMPAAAPAPLGPPPPTEMGAMDTAMQLEIQLPDIGKDDPTLMPYVQGFIARMREEVPKVVQGNTESVSPPPQTAPNDQMMSKIPVTY